MPHDLENRLRILEEGYEYQDRTVEALNEVIIRQQTQIEMLQDDLKKLREQFVAVNLEKDDVMEPPPPHY